MTVSKVRNPTIFKVCEGNAATPGCGRLRPHYSVRRKEGFKARAWCKDCWSSIHEPYRAAYKRRRSVDPEYRKKENARSLARKKISTKGKSCLRCAAADVPLERHHHKGYDYPLDVQILCSPCHAIVDRWAEGKAHNQRETK